MQSQRITEPASVGCAVREREGDGESVDCLAGEDITGERERLEDLVPQLCATAVAAT